MFLTAAALLKKKLLYGIISSQIKNLTDRRITSIAKITHLCLHRYPRLKGDVHL